MIAKAVMVLQAALVRDRLGQCQAQAVIAALHADGPASGLSALTPLDASLPRYTAVAAHLHELAEDSETAAREYAEAAQQASSQAERDHLIMQAARLNSRNR